MCHLKTTRVWVVIFGLLIVHLDSFASGAAVKEADRIDEDADDDTPDNIGQVSDEQLALIAADLGGQLSEQDFWTLVKITRSQLDEEERQVDDEDYDEDEEEHLREIADLIQASFDKVLNERRRVKDRDEFDRLYEQTIVKPCQLIRSIYIRHKDVFDAAPFDEDDDYRVREKEMSKVCVSFLTKKSTRNDLYAIFSSH